MESMLYIKRITLINPYVKLTFHIAKITIGLYFVIPYQYILRVIVQTKKPPLLRRPLKKSNNMAKAKIVIAMNNRLGHPERQRWICPVG
jgi:hypothetical protein